MYVNNILLLVAINNILASINIILIQIMDNTRILRIYVVLLLLLLLCIRS